MNLRCTYCQTPFTVSRMEKLAALQRMQAENLHHYDAFCPRCRRANSVSRQRLEMFTPGWREGLKTLEAEAARLEKEAAMVPQPPPEEPLMAVAAPLVVNTPRKHHAVKPKTAATVSTQPATKEKPAPAKAKTTTKKTAVKAKPAKKTATKAKPAPAKAKKPVSKAKTTAKKPATKAKPAPAKAKTTAKKAAVKAKPAAKKK